MIDTTKYKNEMINLGSREGTDYTMSVYELSRWCCLIEGIEVIDKKIKQTVSRPSNEWMANDDKFWVKPIPLQKYIDERSDEILFDLVNDKDNIKVLDQCKAD